MNPAPRFPLDPVFDWWDAGHDLSHVRLEGNDWQWIALLAFAIVCWIVGQVRNSREAAARMAPREQRPVVLPEVSTKRHKPKGPLFIPLDLGGVVVDLQPERDTTFHVLVSGTSGLGKSSSVVNLLDLPIGVLIVALDNTRPLQKRIRVVGGLEWTNNPRECTTGLDFLCFEPSVSSELIVAGLPEASGDSGQWRRAARARIWQSLEQCDQRRVERTWPSVIAALQMDTGDPEADRACKSWASKLQQVYLVMGQTFGTDLNVVDAMRRGEKVLLRVNRFLSPQDAPMIGAWLMVLARIVAAEAGVPFVLIAEEAGQMGIFKQHISPIAQAARDRGVVLVDITQNPSKQPDEVVNNCSVHISFAHELETEARFVAMLLRLHWTQLMREAFPKTKVPYHQGRGWCYIRAPGLPTTLVQVPNPAVLKPRTPSYDSEPTPSPHETPYVRRYVVREIPQAPPQHVYPALPLPSRNVQEVMDKIDRSQGDRSCWMWTAAVDRDGYAIQRWAYPKEPDKPKNNRPAHQVVWEILNGSPFPAETWDHRRSCPRRCVNPYHGEPMTRGKNSRNMHRTRGHETAAD